MSRSSRGLVSAILALAGAGSGEGRSDELPRPIDPRVPRSMNEWKQGDRQGRIKAISRLGRLGHRSAPVVPDLISGLSDPVPEIRAATAEALGHIASSASAANPALISALRDPERKVRVAAAMALTRTRPDAGQAIPALAASLRADPVGFEEHAVEVLAAMGEPVVPAAIELLREANPKLPPIGAQVLIRLGAASGAAVPHLIEAFHRPEQETREFAAQALAFVGEPAIDPIIRCPSRS